MISVRALGPNGFGVYRLDRSALSLEPADVQADKLFVPGLFDLHIHGAFGIDLMTASEGDLRSLATALGEQGYECFVPTTVTAPAESVLQAVSNIPNDARIAGFHLEGPFISPKYPGAQPEAHISDPPGEPSEWDRVLDHPLLRIVTLAPERPNAGALIRRLSRRGVIVSLGHTDSTYAQCVEAVQSGATHLTHTFNAMRGFHHREPGAAGYALASDSVFRELIYDRIHVSNEAAALLLKCSGAERVIAVSDGTMAMGMPSGSTIQMWGHTCHVGEKSVTLASSGALAGSAITLLDAFRNLCDDFGLEIAIRLCSMNPARALGRRPQIGLLLNGRLEIEEILRI